MMCVIKLLCLEDTITEETATHVDNSGKHTHILIASYLDSYNAFFVVVMYFNSYFFC